jgi:hypothetical protein
MEAIVDTLFGPVTAGMDDDICDDIVMGCMALATGECSETTVVDWIVAHDKERSELEVCLEILRFFRRYRRNSAASETLAAAVAAGMAVLDD